MRRELDRVAPQQGRQCLGGELAVGVVDLMEVFDAMRCASHAPAQLGTLAHDPAPGGARNRTHEERASELVRLHPECLPGW